MQDFDRSRDDAAMDEAEQVSQLIGDVYDAALDPGVRARRRWRKPAATSRAFPRSCCLRIRCRRAPNSTFSWGDDPEYARSYQDTYVKMNPLLLPMVLSTETGSVVANSDFDSRSTSFAPRDFYKEWAQPQGYLDAVSADARQIGRPATPRCGDPPRTRRPGR